MNIQVIGAGVVGQATGKGFARMGHNVKFVDVSAVVVNALKIAGYEAGLRPYEWDITFICAPEANVEGIIHILSHYRNNLVVIRSTVPPGTNKRLSDKCGMHILSNPEFLREGVAEYEFLNPPGVVIGECCHEHGSLLGSLYDPMQVPILYVKPIVAELTKIVINSYLATQISFWNQVKIICDRLDINSHEIGMLADCCDERVSEYGARMHGKPYGGKCLPKDLQQLMDLAKSLSVDKAIPLLRAVQEINKQYGGM